ncbi:MAG TPA: hypothetical protein VJ810_23695 [Blastocatellia bacterium]|nr:hypothetical protein [Blastocatellia bacterium]
MVTKQTILTGKNPPGPPKPDAQNTDQLKTVNGHVNTRQILLPELIAAFRISEQELVNIRLIAAKNCPDHLIRRYLAEEKPPLSIKRVTAYNQLAPSTDTYQNLVKENQQRGVFWLPNPGGASDLDIKRFAATFSEADPLEGADIETFLREQCGIEPPLPASMEMLTYKSLHRYWRITGDCTREQWLIGQQGQIAYYHSDPQIMNESRNMRLPYFNHLRVDFVKDCLIYKPITLHSFHPERCYTINELHAAFPVGPQGLLKVFEKLTQQKYRDAKIEPSEELRREVEAINKQRRSTSGRKTSQPINHTHDKVTTLAAVLEMQRNGQVMNEPVIEPADYSASKLSKADINLIEGTIRRQCFRLANARQHTKHGTLWECGLICGGLVNGGLADAERIVDALLDAVKLAGSSDQQFDINHARSTVMEAVQKAEATTLDELRERAGVQEQKSDTDNQATPGGESVNAVISIAEIESLLNAESGPNAICAHPDITRIFDLSEGDDRAMWLKCKALLKQHGVLTEVEKEFLRIKKKRKEVKKQTELTQRVAARNEVGISGLFEADGWTWFLNQYSNHEPVANFTARIVEDLEIDDEAESIRQYTIEGVIAGEPKIYRGNVGVDEYSKSSPLQWVGRILGATAAIMPRKSEHLRTRVNEASANVVKKLIYAHAGWRNDGNGYRFLHATGAINADGLIATDVKLPDELSPYALPSPYEGAALQQAWNLFTGDLFAVSSLEQNAVLGGSVLITLVDWPDFSTFCVGTSGHGKSTRIFLWLSFFGSGFIDCKPVEWEGSTSFGLQVLAHQAKNLPLFIDEYVPKISRDPQKLQYIATAYLRAQANHSGRTAGKPDATLRARRVPRGGTIAAGEDLPPGVSLRARNVVLEFTDELTADIKKKLTPLQRAARDGVFAGLGAAYIQWLAGRIETVIAERGGRIAELREAWNEKLSVVKVHPRTASNFAHLEFAWEKFFEFGKAKGLITESGAADLAARINRGLLECAKQQAQWLADSDPAKRFVTLIAVALGSGTAHINARDGDIDKYPADAKRAMGWRLDNVHYNSDPYSGTEDERRETWRPQGVNIGWFDGDPEKFHDGQILILPAAARKVVDSYAGNGDGIALSEKRLNGKLVEAGLLAVTELDNKKRATICIRRVCEGSPKTVLCFDTATIFSALEDDEEEDATF